MKKKTVALLLALVMVFGAAVGGTIAYLTAQTTEVKNTFTVGDIGKLTLAETKDTFNIVPGVAIEKDPKVAYDADKNDVAVYVFVKVNAPGWTRADNGGFTKNVTDKTYGLSFTVADGWTYLKQEGTDNYIYYQTLAANTNLTAASVIADDKVNVSGEILDGAEIESLNNTTLTFTAYAIQQATFDDAAAAWAAVK